MTMATFDSQATILRTREDAIAKAAPYMPLMSMAVTAYDALLKYGLNSEYARYFSHDLSTAMSNLSARYEKEAREKIKGEL